MSSAPPDRGDVRGRSTTSEPTRGQPFSSSVNITMMPLGPRT
jgi:hypothetical protein